MGVLQIFATDIGTLYPVHTVAARDDTQWYPDASSYVPFYDPYGANRKWACAVGVPDAGVIDLNPTCMHSLSSCDNVGSSR